MKAEAQHDDLGQQFDKEIEGSKLETKGVRGENVIASKVRRENTLLLFGCKPSLGVARDTFMIRDLLKTLIERLDHSSLSIEFPDVLDSMQGEDASFEMVTSNTIKRMKMFY